MINFRKDQQHIDLNLQNRLLDFIQIGFNHILDVVNFACVDSFENLLHIHYSSCEECRKECCEFMTNIEESYMKTSLINKSRLKAYVSLIDNLLYFLVKMAEI